MEKVKKVSITFSASSVLKDAIGKIAKSMNYTRMDYGTVKPEFTPMIVNLLEYGIAHEEDVRAWLARGKKDVEITSVTWSASDHDVRMKKK